MLKTSRICTRAHLYILSRSPLSYPRRSFYSAMSDTPQTGQSRPAPSSGPSSPIGKKPRLEEPSVSQPELELSIQASTSASAANPKKSHKKLARKAKKKGQHILPEPFSNEDVLWHDVASVLGKAVVDEAVEAGTEWDSPFEFREEVELEVHSLSSNGEYDLQFLCVNLKQLLQVTVWHSRQPPARTGSSSSPTRSPAKKCAAASTAARACTPSLISSASTCRIPHCATWAE